MNIPILIVDDHPMILFLNRLMIEESGLSDNIEDFTGAEEAIEHLESREYDGSHVLIFLDINMPGMSGWDFLEALDTIPYEEKIHVVMVTSSVNRSDREKAAGYRHVVDYIEKPLNIETCRKLAGNDRLSHLFQ